MPHYVEYIPDANDANDPDDFEFNGRWEFTCDCPPTEPCRWTTDSCDCETWSLTIAQDGSWATHPHYVELDESDDIGLEEVPYPMTAVEGPHCNAYWWFTEDDHEWLYPPRAGKQEITVEWQDDYYLFDYVPEGAA